MKFERFLALLLAGALGSAIAWLSAGSNVWAQGKRLDPKTNPVKSFTFAAIGDMPYELPSPVVKFDRLVTAINAAKPAFTFHVGDIFSGRTRCLEKHYAFVKQRFGRFENALIYTPGDNEWTDCHRMFAGQYDPLNRLDLVRRVFFADPRRSLGRKPMKLVPQPRVMPRHARYVENRRFEHGGIVFVTVHVVGSRNNARRDSPAAMAEFQARNKANLAWIKAGFDHAAKRKAKGLVFAWQANVHATPRYNRNAPYSQAYTPVIDAIEAGKRRYRQPVLVISGDFHRFEVAPFRNSRRVPIQGVTRLQVFGADRVHGTLIRVDPTGARRFTIKPLIVNENR